MSTNAEQEVVRIRQWSRSTLVRTSQRIQVSRSRKKMHLWMERSSRTDGDKRGWIKGIVIHKGVNKHSYLLVCLYRDKSADPLQHCEKN